MGGELVLCVLRDSGRFVQMLWSLDGHMLGSGAGKAPSLQRVRVQEMVECVEQQVLGCWAQLIPKLCVPFSLLCLRDVDYGNAE